MNLLYLFNQRLPRATHRLFLPLLVLVILLGINTGCCHAAQAKSANDKAPACHSTNQNPQVSVASTDANLSTDAIPKPDDCCCTYRPSETAWHDQGLTTQGQFQAATLRWQRLSSSDYSVNMLSDFQVSSFIPRGPPPVYGPAIFISQTILLI